MTIDQLLERVQGIHDTAVAKGKPPVLPPKVGMMTQYDGNRVPFAPGGRLAKRVAEAAFAWWLQRWLLDNGCQPDTGGLDYLIPIAEVYLGMEPRP